MSSHSGTIGRKRGGSASEYYFGGGGEQIRRQRSAEWHSHHAYSSSEDEYQNTAQPSAFDTQLLAQLLLQSQQLANLDRYGSDCDNPNMSTAILNEYPNALRDHSPAAAFHMQLQQQNTGLCSPMKQQSGLSNATAATQNNATNKYEPNKASPSAALLPTHASTPRSTNPFLNAKYDSQSNSDSMSDRLSYSGSAVMLDRLQATVEGGAPSLSISGAAALSALNSTFLMPTSSTASILNPSARDSTSSGGARTPRTKSGRALSRAPTANGSSSGATGGMTSSSSGTSSSGNAASTAAGAGTTAAAIAASIIGRSDREKLKLQQIQKELRDYAQSTAESSIGMDLDEFANSGGEFEPPPEPAPPEIPPRTQSLLMSLRKHSDYKLKYEDKGDQKHEEFIPTSQIQQQQTLQKEFLLTDNSRSSENQSSDTQSQAG